MKAMLRRYRQYGSAQGAQTGETIQAGPVLIDIQYDRNDYELSRGTFRVRGDALDGLCQPFPVIGRDFFYVGAGLPMFNEW